MEPIQPLTGWVNSSRMESAGGSGIRTGRERNKWGQTGTVGYSLVLRETGGDRQVQTRPDGSSGSGTVQKEMEISLGMIQKNFGCYRKGDEFTNKKWYNAYANKQKLKGRSIW